ncbi:hypothetical protein CEXT_389571, partial [Caerostris extrusa]
NTKIFPQIFAPAHSQEVARINFCAESHLKLRGHNGLLACLQGSLVSASEDIWMQLRLSKCRHRKDKELRVHLISEQMRWEKQKNKAQKKLNVEDMLSPVLESPNPNPDLL